jgi:predicted dehydrogenase
MVNTAATIGIGLIGYAFMGKAHSVGYRDVSVIAPPEVPRPRLVAIYGRDRDKLREARVRYGWERATTDWQDLVTDPDIRLVDNSGPNRLHVEPTLAAIARGKHVYVEKPLAPDAGDSFRLWQAAAQASVKHMCAFNYRFFPALQLARQIVQSGELGEIHSYRSNFLLSPAADATRTKSWRDDKAAAGALGDLGSHHIDAARFLLGADPKRAIGVMRTVSASDATGAAIENDDMFSAILEFDNGAVGMLEASRVAGGHLVTSRIEVDGAKGSLQFSMQSLNQLQVSGADKIARTITVTGPDHPYQQNWFPPGHPFGWVDSFSHEAMHILGAIGGVHDVAPIGATFRDGYYCAEIVDAIATAARERCSVDITYRSLTG